MNLKPAALAGGINGIVTQTATQEDAAVENTSAAEAIAMLIPIVAIIMGVGIAMLTLVLEHRRKGDTLKLYHAERMAAIEKGLELPPLPPELFQSSRSEFSLARRIRTGLILVFVGIAVFAALGGFGAHRGLAGDASVWSGAGGALWGLVPTAIGIAYLISGFVEAGLQKRGSQGGPGGQPPAGGPPAR
jgi:hypothetical protein